MEERIQQLIIQLRSATESQCEEIKTTLIDIAKEYGVSRVITQLDSLKRKERLPVQWEIEEVMETLEPPKKEVVEDEDDPSDRRLRMSELELVYNDPRGIRLFQSKVDDRWVLMQMDPRTGSMHQQELTAQQGDQIKHQLAMEPYWVRPASPT